MRFGIVKSVLGRDNLLFDNGRVIFEHFLDESGSQIVRCKDNGIGMDTDQIQRFLTKAGRSYYRSPEFERERLGFRAANVDFDPCARFGIGFMSRFMLADKIILHTRKDYGMGQAHGKSLIIEIDGLGGILNVSWPC